MVAEALQTILVWLIVVAGIGLLSLVGFGIVAKPKVFYWLGGTVIGGFFALVLVLFAANT